MNDFNNVLLVPVSLEAFVVNDQVKSEGMFRRWQMKFNWLLKEYRSPEAAPFDNGESDLKKGIYLHWTLPDALKRGTQQANGAVEFPLLPNRWLLVRFSGRPTELQTKSWIIKSDFLGASDGGRYLMDTGSGLEIKSLGHSELITSWPDPEVNAPDLFLTAVGYGHTSFLAYQPFVPNVCSFYDPLDGVDTDQPISYLVVGWYSRPESDILRRYRPTDLQWIINGEEEFEGQPQKSVFHGMVYGIDYSAAVHINSKRHHIQVAVGNTSVEAFSALIKQWAEYKGLTEEAVQADLFRAFQYDLLSVLDAPDGEELLELEARKNWFSGVAGGYQWEIVESSNLAGEKAANKSISLTPAEEAFLYELNRIQTRFEEELRNLRYLQQQLYEMWWKRNLLNNTNNIILTLDVIQTFIPDFKESDINKYRDQFDSEITNLKISIAQCKQALNEIFAKNLPNLPEIAYDTTIKSLEEALNWYVRENQKLEPNHCLKAKPKPNFWTPNDPVLMITGVNQSAGLNRKPELPCRLPNQILYKGEAVFNSPIVLKNAPDLIQKLLAEFFLLQQAHLPQEVKGVIPDPLAVKKWEQPWQPLFMEWEVKWYPIPFENWRFDGQDYRFEGSYSAAENTGVKIKGRNLLTPHNTQVLKAKLEKLAGDNEQLVKFLEGLNDWDFISQRLAGFNHQLIQRSDEFLLPPGPEIKEDVNENYFLLPDLKNKSKHFQEVRQGQFFINQLLIYDAFGQVLGVVEDPDRKFPSLYSSKFFSPIKEANFRPDPPEKTVVRDGRHRFVQMPPRILNPCRLNFTFISAQDDRREADEPGVNPVCGWLIPDRLAKGILVYDQNGIYLGELCPTAGEEVRWVPAPGETILPNNLPLSRIIDTLKSLPAVEFNSFVAIIDETLWTITSAREQGDLAGVVGRPLALIRVKLQLETAGPAVKDPYWPGPDHRDESQLTGYDFRVKVGNAILRKDGVIGYFTETEANKVLFNAVQADQETASFIRKIGPGNFAPIRFGTDSPTIFTILMDPMARIHLETGILPPQEFTLPDKFVNQALNRMEILLPCGPLLTNIKPAKETASGREPASIHLPMLPETGGKWLWLELTPEGLRHYGLEDPGAIPFFEKPSIITEGFLKYTQSREDE